jgi:hypothetical protein
LFWHLLENRVVRDTAIEIVPNIESKFCSAINIQKANAPRIAKFYNAPRKEKATGSISHCDLITTPESRQPDMMSPASALEIFRPALIYDSLPFPIRMLVYLRRKAERLGGNPITSVQ